MSTTCFHAQRAGLTMSTTEFSRWWERCRAEIRFLPVLLIFVERLMARSKLYIIITIKAEVAPLTRWPSQAAPHKMLFVLQRVSTPRAPSTLLCFQPIQQVTPKCLQAPWPRVSMLAFHPCCPCSDTFTGVQTPPVPPSDFITNFMLSHVSIKRTCMNDRRQRCQRYS